MAEVYRAAAHVEAARLVGESDVLDDLAARVQRTVRREAARNRNTGDYINSIKVATRTGPSGVKDRIVYTNDPGALSIEYGHMTIRRHKGSRRASWNGTRVPGQYVFTRAFHGMRGT